MKDRFVTTLTSPRLAGRPWQVALGAWLALGTLMLPAVVRAYGDAVLRRLPAAPVIDGDLADWRGQPLLALGVNSEHERSLSAVVYRGWTDECLVFALRVHDDAVVPGQDGVDCYLDLRARENRGRFPYTPGVLHLSFSTGYVAGPMRVFSLGRGTLLDQAALRQVRAVWKRNGSGWQMEAAIPWSLLSFDPGREPTINFSVAINDSDRVGEAAEARLGVLAPDKSNHPDTDPITFDTLDLHRADATPASWHIAAHETVLNGTVRAHVQLATDGDRPPASGRPLLLTVGAEQRTVIMRPSFGGCFACVEDYVPIPPHSAAEIISLTLADGDTVLWRDELRLPIVVRRRQIEEALPSAAIQKLPIQRGLLVEFWKQAALDLTEEMTLEPRWYRTRQKQLRVRDDEGYFDPWLQWLTRCARRFIDAEPPPFLAQRFHAWRSAIDDSVQVLEIEYPTEFQPGRTYPLRFVFHYFTIWQPNGRFRTLDDLVDIQAGMGPRYWGDVIRVGLYGRGNSFELLGDEEFNHACDFAAQHLPLDPTRVSLGGASHGATDAMIFATRYPDRSRCLNLQSGYYVSVFERCAEATPRERDVLRTLYSPVVRAQSLHDAIGRLAAGEKDPGPVASTLAMADALDAAGAAVRSHIIPGAGHSFALGPLPEETRPTTDAPAIRRVTLENIPLRYARKHGVEVDGILDFGRPWRIDAEPRHDGAITVRPTNVGRFILRTPAPAAVSILTDADPARFPATSDGADARFERGTNGAWWRVAAFSGNLTKNPRSAGPIADLRGRRFLIVIGTTNPATTWALEWRAHKIADELIGTRPGQSSGGRLFIKRDRDVTARDLAEFDLWLLGGARDNALAARLRDRLPIAVDEAGVTVGNRRVQGGNLFVNAIFPDLVRARAYVYLEAGASASAYAAPVMPNLQFDYSVTRVDARTNPVVVRGFFNSAWTFDDARAFWHTRDE